jgi:tRNA pseudouridine13 synthase
LNFDHLFSTAHGEPLASAKLKATPQDFVVEETLSFPLSGEGEHLYLYLRKTNANTDWVSRQLSRQLGVPQRDIGYAGLKDRHGVTAQWFSLLRRHDTEARLEKLQIEGVELCDVIRHTRKLRKGAIKHNHFSICLRDLDAEPARLQQRLQTIVQAGVPNYFDEQRFGRQRGNLEAATAMFARQLKPSRFQRGIYLSAARSWLFNLILTERVLQQRWHRAMAGDVFWLNGTRRFFVADALDASITQRLQEGDIHPTGALWGAGELQSRQDVAKLEQAIIENWPVLRQGLIDARLTQDRRPLRVLPQAMTHRYDHAQHCLQVSFNLPAGAYATAVLREIVVAE